MKNNRILRAAALLMLCCALLTLPACAPSSPAVGKVGDSEIPQSELLYYITSQINNLESNMGVTFENFYAIAPAEAGEYFSAIINIATEQCVRRRLVDRLFDDCGLKFEGTYKGQFTTIMNNHYEQYGETEFRTAVAGRGLEFSQYEDFIRTMVREDALLVYLTGEGMEDAISDAEAREYYRENYSRVKHILIKTVDDANTPLTGDALAAQDALYAELYEQALSVTKDSEFDRMVEEYSEDPGSTQYPEGYVLTMNDSFVEEFKAKAFSLKIGEVGSCKSTYGYHIMRRYDPLETEALYTNRASDVMQAMRAKVLTAKLDALREQVTVEMYQDKIDALTLEEVRALMPK